MVLVLQMISIALLSIQVAIVATIMVLPLAVLIGWILAKKNFMKILV